MYLSVLCVWVRAESVLRPNWELAGVDLRVFNNAKVDECLLLSPLSYCDEEV